MTKYAVYVLDIKPLEGRALGEAYEKYVGSTYVDGEHQVDDRVDEHHRGYKSNVVKRGYGIVRGRKVGRLHLTRAEAEAAERAEAKRLRGQGYHVWQA